MRTIELGFSSHKKQKQKRSNLVVVILLMVVFLCVLLEKNTMMNQIAELESAIGSSQGRQQIVHAKPTERDLIKLQEARTIQQKLNFPWDVLLAAIETVKQEISTVSLLTIQPNPAKGEVILGADAVNVKAMLAFVTLLEQQAIFNNVLLINQREIKHSRVAFTLKMEWKV